MIFLNPSIQQLYMGKNYRYLGNYIFKLLFRTISTYVSYATELINVIIYIIYYEIVLIKIGRYLF